MGFIRVLFSSPKRIAQASFVFLAILAVPITLTLVKEQQEQRSQASGGCTYKLVGGRFLCFANEEQSSSTAPTVPDNMTVYEGDTAYVGEGGFVPPDMNIVYSNNTTNSQPQDSPNIGGTQAESDTTQNSQYCTTTQLQQGVICLLQNAGAGCGCPPGWACNYVGRQNLDGTQSVQCKPPLNGGISVGQVCSPAGAPCAPVLESGKNYEANCVMQPGGNYSCVKSSIFECGSQRCNADTQTCASDPSGNKRCIGINECVIDYNCTRPNSCVNNVCTPPTSTSTTTTATSTTDTTASSTDTNQITSSKSSNQMKITLKKNGTPIPNVSLTLDTVLKSNTSSVVRTETQTTDASGIATFTRPNSISSSFCRNARISTTYCNYFDNYFSRNFSYKAKINTTNILFASNNTPTYSISNHEDISLDVVDTTPPSTTYSCDFDGQNGPDLPDYTIWLGEFRSGQKNKADCDNSGSVDIFDYAMWLGEFKKKNAEQ